MRVISGKAGTPHPVQRRSLDQNPVPGTQQELPQVRVLAELSQVPGHHQPGTLLGPALLIKSASLPTQRLRLTGMRRRHDALCHLLIAEQPRLSRHHEMLRRQIHHVVHGEGGRPPLAQAALPCTAARGRLMSPEQQVLRLPAVPDKTHQLVDSADIRHGYRHAPCLPGRPDDVTQISRDLKTSTPQRTAALSPAHKQSRIRDRPRTLRTARAPEGREPARRPAIRPYPGAAPRATRPLPARDPATRILDHLLQNALLSRPANDDAYQHERQNIRLYPSTRTR